MTAGFVGFDENGRFVHYCHCGAWAAYGYGVKLLRNEHGVWFCKQHRPPDAKPPVFVEPPQRDKDQLELFSQEK